MQTFLNNIPAIGLGTWQVRGNDCVAAVSHALDIGYIHIDTADVYGNHKEVGKGIRQSGIDREKIFLTTKIWRDDLHTAQVQPTVERFLKELDTEYIDLLLIHWPNKDIHIGETLAAMQKMKEEGLVRSIGVSNFTINHLREVLATQIPIAANQVEFHPSLYQKELLEFCKEHAIQLIAYSPIAQGADLRLPEVQAIAKNKDITPSQVILSWLLHKEIVAIPRSTRKERIKENLEALHVVLTNEEIATIDTIGGNHRIVAPSFQEFDK